METLHTWWATELYPMRERDQFGVSGEFEVVLATDAQATIAALQAQIESANTLLYKKNCALGQAETIINDLQSQLTQRTAELHETQNHLADADNEVEQLRKQLSERTAELEAASKAIAEWRKEIDSVLDKLDGREGDVVALQAELERVRGEIAEKYKYHDLFKQWQCWRDPDELVNEYEKYQTAIKENEILRTLIAALPKVEGEIRVGKTVDNCWFIDNQDAGGLRGRYKDDGPKYAALLQHRQGMEG